MNEKVVIAFMCICGVSGFISMVGSSLIIYIQLSNAKEKLRKLQNRFLLSMSIIDIFYSIAFALSVVPIPRGECSFGFGNMWTCTVQGFFIQFGLSVSGYVAMLSLSCFLSIVRNISNEMISQKFELYMHAFAILPMLGVAIGGAAKKLFFSYSGHCWIERRECKEDCAGVGGGLKAYGEGEWVVIATMVWVLVTTTIIFICMVAVVREIKNRPQRKKGYHSPSQTQNDVDVVANDATKQVLLYIFAYTVTYIWSFIDVVSGTEGNDFMYIMSAIFLPLQGFWNFLVYIRPRYLAIHREREELSFISVLKVVIFGDKDENDPQQPRPMRQRLSITAKVNLQNQPKFSLVETNC